MHFCFGRLHRRRRRRFQNAVGGARRDARRRRSRSRVWYSAESAVRSACAFLRVPTGTSRCALAITIGRPSAVAQNALDFITNFQFIIEGVNNIYDVIIDMNFVVAFFHSVIILDHILELSILQNSIIKFSCCKTYKTTNYKIVAV